MSTLSLQLNRITGFIERLNAGSVEALRSIASKNAYKKGQFLLRQDEVCKRVYGIEKGIARKYYLNDGKQITTELLFDNDIAVSLASYCSQQPSLEFIEALTDTTVWRIEAPALLEAKQSFRELETLDVMLLEYYAMWLEQQLFCLHTMDASTRYKKLIDEHPSLVLRIPLIIVASYLGISLETLSRIRAR